MAKQTIIPKVDEDFMKEIISQGFPSKRNVTSENAVSAFINEEKEKSNETHQMKESSKRKRTEQPNYREMYFGKEELADRQAIYITRETHQTLLRIVSVVGGHKATISNYVENIICQHLENHKEEINSLYETKFKKPIS
ncbi:MAG: DUF3408 domain-containing protein [Paludibacter sp.]|nr:DUF3408 domain-containing protein [Paludibacter sp.]